MTHGIFREQSVRQAVVVIAILLAGAGLAVADDDGAAEGRADRYPIAPKIGAEKVLEDYIHCGHFDNMGDYHYWYTPSGVTDVFLCVAGEVRTSNGNANLYIYLGGVWNDATTPLPRDQAGQLICSSANGGTATDACNGCNYACAYILTEVWRSYAVPASIPTDYCNQVWVYDCQSVDLSRAGAVRRGTEVDVTWEVTEELGTAGYRLYRRFDLEQEWTLITDALVPVSDSRSYRVVDTVPASVGNIYYKLENVALDGTAEHVVYIAHEVPIHDLPPEVGE